MLIEQLGDWGREFKSPAPTNKIKQLACIQFSEISFGVPVGFPRDTA